MQHHLLAQSSRCCVTGIGDHIHRECPGLGKRIVGTRVPCAEALAGSEEDVFLSRAASNAKVPGVVRLMVRSALVLLQSFLARLRALFLPLRALRSLEMFLLEEPQENRCLKTFTLFGV